jgi:flagellar biosynthesis/type III secretory pathway chaperone
VSAQARELVEVLDRETELVKQLVEILQEDQQRIIRHDVAGLERANLLKEERVLQFQSLEHLRARLVEGLGRELGLSPDEARVSRICPLLGAEGAALRASADRLRALVAGLGELIAVSRGFLEQSILGVRSLLSLIHSLRTPEPGTYDARGRMVAAPDPGAVSLRREV